MTTEHTQTPWAIVLDDEMDDLMRIVQVDGYGETLRLIAKMPRDADWSMSCANARFIVQAVNAHDELEAALIQAVSALRVASIGGRSLAGSQVVKNCEAALALAEAG